MTNNKPILLAAEEAISRYQLTEHFTFLKKGNWYYDDVIAGTLFMIYEGDTLLPHNLCLDYHTGTWRNSENNHEWRKQFNLDSAPTGKGITGILFLNNLDIQGSLLNCDDEQGVLCFIAGNLEARNISAGGAAIAIAGNAHINECVYAHYNDGSLKIKGDLTTTVYINDGHESRISGKLQAPWKVCSQKYIKNTPKFRYDDEGELRIPAELKNILSPKIKTEEDILRMLEEEGRILRQPDEAAVELTYQEWLSLIIRKPSQLSKLPQQHKTEQFFIDWANSISCFNDLEIIRKFPKAYLTEAVKAAITKSCQEVSDYYLLETQWGAGYALREIPPPYRTLKMFKDSLLNGVHISTSTSSKNTYTIDTYQYMAMAPEAWLETLLAQVDGSKILANFGNGKPRFYYMDYLIDTAKLAAWKGNYTEALQLLLQSKENAIKVGKGNAGLNEYKDYRPCYYEGYIHHLQGNKEKAKECFELARELYKNTLRELCYYPHQYPYGNEKELIPYNKRINYLEEKRNEQNK